MCAGLPRLHIAPDHSPSFVPATRSGIVLMANCDHPPSIKSILPRRSAANPVGEVRGDSHTHNGPDRCLPITTRHPPLIGPAFGSGTERFAKG